MNVPFQHPTHLTRWRIPTIRWQALINLVLMALLVATLVALPAPAGASPRVHDALLLLAETQPSARVNVIVRHDGQPAQVAASIRQLGGHVIRELGFINSLLANMRAGDVLTLGRTPGVAWVSPDASMVDKTCPDCADTAQATAAWLDTVGMKQLWSQNSELQGQDVTVAVLDSGISDHYDLYDSWGYNRVRASVPVLDNLVLNGDFEDDLNQWAARTGQIDAYASDWSHSGQAAMWMPARDTFGLPTGYSQQLTAFIPGETYTLGAWAALGGAGCDRNGGVWVGVAGISNGIPWGTGLWYCDTWYTYKSIQFTIPLNTQYVEVFTRNASTTNDFVVDDISVTPVQPNSTSASWLLGNAEPAYSMVDLTGDGGVDWAHWANDGSVNRRSGVPARIQMSMLNGSRASYRSSGGYFTWNNGTPRATSTTNGGAAMTGAGKGFEIRVPATTTYRTLRVYATARNTRLRAEAFLNDGSSLPFVDTSVETFDGYSQIYVYTFSFKADTDARQLTVRIQNDSNLPSNALIALNAATLSDGSAIPVSSQQTIADGQDQYGHGTLIAGLIGGDGMISGGQVIGVAPRSNLLSVRVLDANGEATVSDVVRGMEWILKNKDRYNIRVVNMSLNSSVQESYHTNPLSAAAEILWMNGIVMVVSAGNNGGSGVLFPPANDPFVITVGATDDRGTPATADDALASFSARGATEAGTAKPEILAPGVNLTSLNCDTCAFSRNYPNNVEGWVYFRASGTSLSAAVVSGAAALVLQQSPDLTPDQVKFRLVTSGFRQFGAAQPPTLNVPAAVFGTSTQAANTGLPVSQMLFTGEEALTADSARWGSARWGSARWGSARWGSTTAASSMRVSVTGMARWGSREVPPPPPPSR